MKATKFDKGKLRLELLPTEAIEGVAAVLASGAEKYGDYNWRMGMLWSRLIGSTLRHFFKFIRGVDIDDESGLPHIDHVMANIMFLSTYQKLNLGKDDRFKGGSEAVEVTEEESKSGAEDDVEVVYGAPGLLSTLKEKL